MTPLDAIRDAQSRALVDDDGDPVELVLLPGLTEAELSTFENRLPCALPGAIAELLHETRGIEGAVEQLEFTGRDMWFEAEEIFPHGLPIAADGFGNFWVVDLSPTSEKFGPIWFACHDAPIVLYQSADLTAFLVELFKMFEPPHRSLVDDVHEDRIADVWRANPGVMTHEACVASDDAQLRTFAQELDPTFSVIDLRNAKPGDGFSWGRYGPKTVVKRFGYLPIFAVQRQVGWLGRLLGRG